MKKIYLLFVLLFLIKMVNAQNCSPKNVPYNFRLTNDSCTATYYGASSSTYLWLPYSNSYSNCISMFATLGDAYHEAWYFTEGIRLVKGKKYLVSISYEGDLNNDIKFAYGSSQSNSMYTFLDISFTKCYQDFRTVEITANDTGVYYFGVCVYFLAALDYLRVCNISIKEITCPSIINKQVLNVTPISAQINWSASATTSSFDVYYANANNVNIKCKSSLQYASAITTTTNDSITLTGLLPNTKYYYAIRSRCDSSNIGEWPMIDSFFTDCLPFPLPYLENFNLNALSNCTSTQNLTTNSYNNWIIRWANCLAISSYQNYEANAWFYTPRFYFEAGKSYRVSFKYFASDTAKIQSLEIKYGLSANNLAMNNLIKYFTPFKATTTPTISSTVFSPSVSDIYYLGFHNFGNAKQGEFYIDDISVTDNNILFVTSFLDKNSNNLKDPGESDFTNAKIITKKNGYVPIVSATSGGYATVDIDTGTYTTQVVPALPYYTTLPLFHTTTNTAFLQADTAIFAVQKIPGKRDLSIHLIPFNNARPGFTSTYQLSYSNQGTDTVLLGMVEMIIDSRSSFLSAIPAPTTTNGDTLRWSFLNLAPSAKSDIFLNLQLQPPPVLNLNDMLNLSATISSEKSDQTPIDNTTTLNQFVRGSYDPNDKIESHGGSILKTKVDNGEFLQYTIRFQNTGNDTAFNVTIKDTLDSKLNWSSFRMIDASHNYQLTLTEANKCEWTFKNINLPDSNVNEKLSHGFVTFIVKIKPSVVVGNTIANKAAIYFDFNPPVITNTENTKVVANTLPLQLLSFTATFSSSSQVAVENIRKVILQWSTANEINLDRFEVEKSSNGRNFETIGKVKTGLKTYSFIDEKLLAANAFYYRLKMMDKDGKFTYSPVRYIRIDNALSVDLFPNPAKDKLQVVINSEINKATDMLVQLITDDGKVASNFKWEIQEGKNNKTIDISLLQKGNYYLKIVYSNNEYKTVKFKKL